MSFLEMRCRDFARMVQECQAAYPKEACGLLLGRAGTVEVVWPLCNVARQDDRFWADPDDQLAAFCEMEDRGLELTAIYHSHPGGTAYPSTIDMDYAYWPDSLAVIVSGPPWPQKPTDDGIGVFQIRGGTVRPVRSFRVNCQL